MQVLRSRLYELELEKRQAETAELEANKADISFGSQISYVLAPISSSKIRAPDLNEVTSTPFWAETSTTSSKPIFARAQGCIESRSVVRGPLLELLTTDHWPLTN